MNFTPEQMNKAKSAKSADELLTMAKEAGIELTADEAAKYFAELNKQGELSDDELDAVAGGDKGTPEPQEYDVKAGWAPCGCFQMRSNTPTYLSTKYLPTNTDMCGKCIHFNYLGEIYTFTWGKCRRDFDSQGEQT